MAASEARSRSWSLTVPTASSTPIARPRNCSGATVAPGSRSSKTARMAATPSRGISGPTASGAVI